MNIGKLIKKDLYTFWVLFLFVLPCSAIAADSVVKPINADSKEVAKKEGAVKVKEAVHNMQKKAQSNEKESNLPVQKQTAGSQAAVSTAPTNAKKKNNDRFTPTEAISEDLAVSFPTDI